MVEALAETLLWGALGLLFYLHFGYPALLWLLSRLRPRPVRRGDCAPTVDLIIGAYNEEGVLRKKIQNCLELDYPRDRLRVIVASDASTDGTHAIVREFADRGVSLAIAPHRRGKAANFREIVPALSGEILLFSDAGSFYRPDTLRRLVRNFADPEVGCVGGRVRYSNPDRNSVTQGEALYWRYEVFLREAESAIGSAVVLSGAVYAIRRELYRPVPDHLPDDFMGPLNVLDQGKRVLYDTETEIEERMATSARGENETKVRIVGRNFSALMSMRHLLDPRRNLLISLQLLSHRLLRWFVMPVACVMFLANALLLDHPFYALLFAGQVTFYFLAALGFLLDARGRALRMTTLPFYFVLVNYAAAVAIGRRLTGRGLGGTWEPVER